MAEVRIPVDLFNPGQVFACLGFVEAADVLLGDSEGAFDWSDGSKVQFVLGANGDCDPVGTVLDFLAGAAAHSLSPSGSANSTEKWQVPTHRLADNAPFPFPDPSSPATLPALLMDGADAQIVIDHWGDATERDNVKFWAGSGGYPGAGLVRDALALIRPLPPDAYSDPFAVSALQSSSLRLDWRRDYVPMDAGFSPNAHSAMVMKGYPVVEVLAAIGLGNARPRRISKVDKLEYSYTVIGTGESQSLFCPALLRAALGCSTLPFHSRTFRMRLDWPGQENQARCITSVLEESFG